MRVDAGSGPNERGGMSCVERRSTGLSNAPTATWYNVSSGRGRDSLDLYVLLREVVARTESAIRGGCVEARAALHD
jgi:hypothetical protein